MIDENLLIQSVSSPQSVTNYVDLQTREYKQNLSFPGLYVFWFDNRDEIADKLDRVLIVDGPDRIEQKLVWDWNLKQKRICLYVGKSTNLQKRLGLHLLLKTPSIYQRRSNRLLKKTTSCQLRSGFDFLYQSRSETNILDEIGSRLLYSFLPEEDFVKRFYMEDLLVGKLLPWFNADSER